MLPELDELKEFTDEPVFFHDISTGDMELQDDDCIEIEKENVTYTLHPTYAIENLENDERDRFEYPEWPLSAKKFWQNAVDSEIVEDFVCLNYIADEWYEAYWVIEDITIENPKLYQ